tara:strand:- start:3356 stop:4036 length:681 start_codon:yes stop_codon:yes gene_type:complete
MTKDELIQLGITYIETTGEYPASNKWTIKTGGCCHDRMYEIFGNWPNYIKELSKHIDIPNNSTQEYNKIELLKYIHDFVAETKEIPRVKDFRNNSKRPTSTTYQNYFGSWNKAIEAAGYSPNIQNGFGINTKGLDGHLYRSRAEAYFCDNYLFNKVDYEIEPKYPEPYDKWYDWYLPESDTYIELDGGIRPKVITEKIKINKQLNRKLLIITTKDIYKNKFSFEPL